MKHNKPLFGMIKGHKGFTLVELLICLYILALIATFTIPKLLVTQQNQQYNASAKEMASLASAAYQQLQFSGSVTSSTRGKDLSPYMNYLSVDTSSLIDNIPGATTNSCSSSNPCLNLHNGGKLMLWGNYFAGTTNNVIFIQYDPDGVVTDGTTSGPGKSVKFAIYYNGMITSRGNIIPGSKDNAATYNPDATADPPWFSW